MAPGPVRSGPKAVVDELLQYVCGPGAATTAILSPSLLLDDGSREAVNSWLHRLDVGYELAVEPLSSDLFAVSLIDNPAAKRRIEVSLTAWATWISQCTSYYYPKPGCRRALTTIEQPELHIHPKPQAELGTFLREGTQAALQQPVCH